MKKTVQKSKMAETANTSGNKKRGLSIREKLNGMIICIVLLFSALLIFTAQKSMDYNTQYEGVLTNISKISYIKTNSTKVARTVVNLCAAGGSIADSGHQEIVATMQQYITDIGENIGDDVEYNQNKSQLNSLASEVEKSRALLQRKNMVLH